jgi:hypothetical protein
MKVDSSASSFATQAELEGRTLKTARFSSMSDKLLRDRFRNTFSIYTATLIIFSTLVAIFCISFFVAYFDPNFIAEYRTAAPVTTVLGFMKGINPFQEEFLEMYGNAYSVLWPGLIYLIAKLLDLASYDEIRLLMFALNAVIVMGTAAAGFYIGLRNNLNALLALAIGFTYVLINSTIPSMGTYSYSAGLSCSFFALVIASNRFDKSALCWALALITLSSLFKIYFALLGIVVLFNYAAFIPVPILSLITCAWVLLTAMLFFGLTCIFPFYFDSVYCLQRAFQRWEVALIMPGIRWFFTRFGFIFLFTLPQLAQFRHRATEEKRRQAFYAAGSLIVCGFVLVIMLPQAGYYQLHLVAPIILAYALSSRQDFSAKFDRRIGQVAALAMCLMVFVHPKHWSNPLLRWKQYGVVWRDDLSSNRRVLMNADDLIQSNAGRDIYIAPVLAPLAVKRNLGYLDNGNREAHAEYLNARRGPERISPIAKAEQSEVAICNCEWPTGGSHRFDRSLGVLTTASTQSFEIRVYYKEGIAPSALGGPSP